MKGKRLALALGFIFSFTLLAGLVPPEARAAARPGQEAGAGITIELRLPAYEVVRGSDGLDRIEVSGFAASGLPGSPQLPQRVYHVALPPDASIGALGVEVLEADVVMLPGAFQLPLAVADSTSAGAEAIPSELGYLPASEQVSGTFVTMLPAGQMRKWQFARLQFTPFIYDVESGELSVVTRVVVRISYGESQMPQDVGLLSDGAMDDVAQRLFVNYTAAQAWYQVGDRQAAGDGASAAQEAPSATYDYVIVTTNAIEAGSSRLGDFVTHKQAMGYSVLTITEDEYEALNGQAPDGRAEKIRQWLMENYLSYGIRYVLLIGNPDPDDPELATDAVGEVPMKMCWPRRTATSSREAPTDYFYADLTGDWDADGDGYYGEWEDYSTGGGVDLAPELYVGRIPVYGGDHGTLDGILGKIINYEMDPDPMSWRKSALLPMSFSSATYDGAPLGEQMVDDYLAGTGYTVWRQYQQGNGACGLNSEYASDEELRGGQVVRDRWQSGDYGLVVWWGHGSSGAAWVGYSGCWDGQLFNSGDASYLDDTRPSFVYQNSCNNGYPEYEANPQYALLKQGSIGTVGATRNSWYNSGTGYGDFDGSTTNSGIGYEYASRLVAGQAAGDALYNGKTSMMPQSTTRLMNFYDFNLYGDPSVALVSAGAPEDVQAPTGTILINDGSAATNNAAVNLSLSAYDNVAVTGMNLLYDGSWHGWETYASEKNVTLAGGSGAVEVSVKYRDAAGNVSSTDTDGIILDTTPPESVIDELRASGGSATVTASWSGDDDVSGLACFDVQYRDGPLGSWVDWLTCTTDTSAPFTGILGHTYFFRSSAEDQAGNDESYPDNPDYDAYVTLAVPSAVTLASFVGSPGTAEARSGWVWLALVAVTLAGGVATLWLKRPRASGYAVGSRAGGNPMPT